MQKLEAADLKFVRSKSPLPAVEVDLDSIPEEQYGYDTIVSSALSEFAANHPKATATLHVFHGPSVNFHTQTWSAFFGVAGNEKLLDVLRRAFESAHISKVRFSDYIDPSTAVVEFHVQDAQLWRPYEAGVWYSDRGEPEPLFAEAEVQGDEVDALEEEREGPIRSSTPVRFRAARSDATVGAIRKAIEEAFGLPKGSVALCAPDKSPLRRDARISTLRKRWE